MRLTTAKMIRLSLIKFTPFADNDGTLITPAIVPTWAPALGIGSHCAHLSGEFFEEG